MTLVKFLDIYNYAPYDGREVAEAAIEVTDHIPLAKAAKEYLDKEQTFFDELDKISFEFG